ncbi:MAG: recombinase RecA [Treponema sp.]|jgi:recombination protein RecA|nr:recombinase RecA [Treponema sp.]
MAKTNDSEKSRIPDRNRNPLVSAEEKEKALEAARLQIEKQYGSGLLMKLGSRTNATGIEIIPSGSILLDEALGIGGYPRGRIIEIYGPESSGKTTLALHAIAEAQKMGGIAAFVDAEHALDPVYAKNLGVNTDDLWISQPDSGEQALEITESLVRSGAVDVIVVDSVAALTPQAEINGEMGDAQMGLQARLMSQAMRKLTAILGKSRSIIIFINQMRMKIGVFFGNPETTTGGNALKFYSSVRIEVRKTETIEKGEDDAVGNRVRIKVVKNKVAPPFRRAELELMFGKGISAIGSILDAAAKHNIIDKKGSWYSYGEEKIAQGRDGAKEYLEQHPEFTKEVETKLRKIIFPGRDFTAPVKPAAAVPDYPAAASSPPGGDAPDMVPPPAAPVPAVSPPDTVPARPETAFRPAGSQAIPPENTRPEGRRIPAAAGPAPRQASGFAAGEPAALYPESSGTGGQPLSAAPVRRGPGRPRKNPLAEAPEDGLF